MSSSPVVVRNSQIGDKTDPNSPNKPGSNNKLNQPRLDEEPNQPLFAKNEFNKAELQSSKSGQSNSGAEGGSAMLQTALKLKDQNNRLKDQLKELKITLRETLAKVQQKNQTQNKSIDPRDAALVKELEEYQIQLAQYKKEAQALKNRLEAFHNQDKVMSMENSLKDKNRQLDLLNKEKRNLEKIKANQDQELDRLHRDFGYEKKIDGMNEESKQLREKIKKINGVNRDNEKIFKQQQEYLVTLSNQYRIICDKLQIAPSLNFTKAEELNNIITKKAKEAKQIKDELASYKTNLQKNLKSKGEKKDSVKEESKKTLEPTQENINKLQASIDALQNKAVNIEKEYAKEIATAQAQKQESLSKFKELELRLKDKEKEASILNHRVTELKRIVRFNALRPLGSEEPTKELL